MKGQFSDPGPAKLRPPPKLQDIPGFEEASQLKKMLEKAKPAQQDKLLTQVRDAGPEVNGQALALAIPDLSETLQPKARKALAERLSRLKPDALRDMLFDGDLEMARAAITACVMQTGKAQPAGRLLYVPDLLKLLDDPDEDLVLASAKALKKLTGQDFGPNGLVPTLEQRAEAAAAWQEWWEKQQKKKKK